MKNILNAIVILLMVCMVVSVISLRRDMKTLPEETANKIKDSLDKQNANEQAFRDSLYVELSKLQKKDWTQINNFITNKYETQADYINHSTHSDIDSFFSAQMAGVGEHIE